MPNKTFRESSTSEEPSPRKRSMIKNSCSNCVCCGSAQMVQQQLKLVATLSGQLHVHLASYQKHQMQRHSPTVQTQPMND